MTEQIVVVVTTKYRTVNNQNVLMRRTFKVNGKWECKPHKMSIAKFKR